MKRTSLADEWDEKQRSAARHEAVLDHYRNINQEVGALNDDALKSSSEWWRTDPHRREINPSLEEARVKRLPDYVPDGRDYLLRPGEKDKLFEPGGRLLSRYSDADGQRLDIVHAGGHTFPREKEAYEQLRDFAVQRGILTAAPGGGAAASL